MNKNLQLKWIDFHFPLNNQLLTFNSIKLSLLSLFEERLKNQNQEQSLAIIFKIKMENENIRSVSFNQIIKLKEITKLISIFNEYWDIRSEDYHLTKINSIIFTYTIFPFEIEKQSKITRASKFISLEKKRFKFSGFNLPNTMDPSQWGKIEYLNNSTQAIVTTPYSKAHYHIFIYESYIEVFLKRNEVILLSWIDTKRDKTDLSSFTRLINKTHEYIFEKGEILIKKIKRKTSFLKPIKLSLYRSEQIITMDLETKSINENNKETLIPICVSLYDGTEIRSFHISNFKNKDQMLEKCIQYLMRRKYSGYKVFLHNFSYFDGIFLMKSLSELSDELKPIMREERLIELRFKFGRNFLYFRDSYLLLPSSLSSLAKNFGVENKSFFPFKFLNSVGNREIENKIKTLDYIGKVPSFESFSNISKEEYKEYCLLFKDKEWNMKEELIKYCEQDVITLHQVITEFSKEIFKLFRVDILKYPTLPSLAFAIYRSKYLKDHKIPLIDGEIYDNVKEGYTGGAVDVYKPYGEKIYRYDVNSLYPSVMKENVMPTGTPIFFEGDILKVDKNAFGFFNVEVESPKKMNIPILQVKVKTEKGGIKSISPLGNWQSTYFSEEIKKAMKLGYKFKIISGYLFEKDYIFDEYVDFLYVLKLNSEKGSPNYIIAKLLLNSLYGRFGMSPYMPDTILINESDSFKFAQEYSVSNILDLKNGKILMTYYNELDLFKTNTLNISIPISAAITAYARMHMTDFKLMKGLKVYYSDTDSIDINKPLNLKFVGKELGKMKLEHVFEKIIYLAPKVYGGISAGKEYIKIKGLKNPVSFDKLTPLLDKDKTLSVSQDKWYRDMSNAKIVIKNEIYTIMVTDNKRLLIYNKKNKFIKTKPLLLKNGVITHENDESKNDKSGSKHLKIMTPQIKI